jgi:hypothetical protein
MHDAALVSFFERGRNLVCNRARLVGGDRTVRDSVRERGTFTSSSTSAARSFDSSKP